MCDEAKDNECGQDDTDSVTKLRKEIEALQQRLHESARKSQQLSCDTELLLKKTQRFKTANVVSCTDPNWRQILEGREMSPEGILVTNVRGPEQIEFIAAFAADRRLNMTYGDRSFLLEKHPE